MSSRSGFLINYLWHNLQLVHRLEDYHGTPIINLHPHFVAHPHYSTPYMGTDGRWNGANSPIDPWQHGNEGGAGRGDRRASVAGLTPGSAHCIGKPRARGGHRADQIA